MEQGKKECEVHDAREQIIDLWYRAESGGFEKKILARCAGILTHICYGFDVHNAAAGALIGTSGLHDISALGDTYALQDVPVNNLQDDNLQVDNLQEKSENFFGEVQNYSAEAFVRELTLISDILEKNGSELCRTALLLVQPLLSDNIELLKLHVTDKQCQAGICFRKLSPPCQKACPAGIDIPGFMAETGKKNYREAVKIITETNPFPYVCGMICPAPCEKACLRQYFDEPVFIRTMKAVAAKETIKKFGTYPKPVKKNSTGKRVAIAGSGPAGLSAAFFLAKAGHFPVVFESEEKPGGMLRYGIPDFRLPVDILNQDISWIKSNGVEIKTGQKVQGISDFFKKGFHAVFLSTGIPRSRKIPFKGNDLPHVLSGVDFLRRVNKNENPSIGSEVVVIGGGNVAVDVAMAALRQGAVKVHMVCLENADEMPASRHELKIATDEGIVVHNSWGPFKATADKTFEAVFCKRVFDETGRFSPEFDNEKKLNLHSDNILIAAGQAADLSFLEENSGIKTERGLISVKKNSYETDRQGVFAGGDVVSGPGIAVEAIKSGKQAARVIDAWLTGRKSIKSDNHNKMDFVSHMPPPLKVNALDRQGMKRARLEEERPEKRKNNYLPVEFELDSESAVMEAGRCLRCDICIGCGLCQFICSEMGVDAIRLAKTDDDRFVFVDFTTMAEKCISCGACGEVCPTGAIKIVQHDIERKTEFTGTDMCEHQVVLCAECKKPVMPERYYDFLEKGISKHQIKDKDSLRLCQACTRSAMAAKMEKFSFFRSCKR